jgi:hypothetical protein
MAREKFAWLISGALWVVPAVGAMFAWEWQKTIHWWLGDVIAYAIMVFGFFWSVSLFFISSFVSTVFLKSADYDRHDYSKYKGMTIRAGLLCVVVGLFLTIGIYFLIDPKDGIIRSKFLYDVWHNNVVFFFGIICMMLYFCAKAFLPERWWLETRGR